MNYVITISHQLGSGGAYLGQILSEQLGIPFFDREILKKVADQLHMEETELEYREERLTSYWQSFARVAALSDPVGCLSLEHYQPSDQELFQLESQTIMRIVKESSAIFIGRCGRYILRDHPDHFSILVHSDLPARIERIQQLFCLTPKDAKKLIETNDRERAAYIRAFTHQEWLDARLYNLCVNTARIGFDKTADLALACLANKIPA